MKILVLGDIHGNAVALEAVLTAEADADASIYLGDSVLSGPQGNAVLEMLKTLPPGPTIMGNHDMDLLEPERFAKYPAEWLDLNTWLVDHFDKSHLPWLSALGQPGEYRVGDIDICLHHGLVEGGPRHALPDSPDDHLQAIAGGSTCPLVFFGHSHVQFERVINGQRFINPGSIGQNRCGHVIACYGVIEDGQYEPRSVPFDAEPWCAAIDEIRPLDDHARFRSWLKDGIRTGYGVGKNDTWTSYAERGFR